MSPTISNPRIDPEWEPSLYDELRSIRRWLYLGLDPVGSRGLEIRTTLPEEGEDYDVLVEIPSSRSEAQGKAISWQNHGVVIYWVCATHHDAVLAKEQLLMLLERGFPITDTSTDPDTVLTETGWKRRIPLWDWDVPGNPAPPVHATKGFLRVSDDVTARINPQQDPREFTVIIEFTAQGFRITRETPVAPTINIVNTFDTWKV